MSEGKRSVNGVIALDIAHMILTAVRQSQEEGRDVTAEELNAIREKLGADIDRIQSKIDDLP